MTTRQPAERLIACSFTTISGCGINNTPDQVAQIHIFHIIRSGRHFAPAMAERPAGIRRQGTLHAGRDSICPPVGLEPTHEV